MRALAFIALAWVAATGCGNLTAGGFGEVNVYVSGDEPQPSPHPAAASVSPAQSSHAIAVGDVDVSFFAYLRSEDGSGFQLGIDELFAQQLPIDGSEERLLKIQLTPEDRYTEVRLIFTQVTANVVGGLPVVGDVSVDLASNLTVSRVLDLDLSDDEEVDLVVDLNAPAWLQTADPVTRMVDPAVFAALVEVSLR